MIDDEIAHPDPVALPDGRAAYVYLARDLFFDRTWVADYVLCMKYVAFTQPYPGGHRLGYGLTRDGFTRRIIRKARRRAPVGEARQ